MPETIAPPLQDVREAVWERIDTHAATADYQLAREGHRVEGVYLAVTATYKGEGGTDPDYGVYVVQQIDAYAPADAGGSKQVSTMIQAVYKAISDEIVISEVYRPLTVTVEADVLNAIQQDKVTGEVYAQRFVRFKFMVTT